MSLPGPRSDVMATFRDAGQPRPLADRPLAVAHRHARGWTVCVIAGPRFERTTFDGVAEAVTRQTGIRKLLIVWSGTVS
ncbi:hypothetical protein [Actinoplanes sp. NPDC049681]|uniref:hypothetical protein n=1 Tax=Actinoplanes sp. NPDC049681 TaxID=3363905 RepID=UPI00378EFA01